MMKKYISLLFIFSFTTHILGTENQSNHVILPRQFHVGQEFIYEGIPYVIKGFDQEKKGDCEKVTLILEYPISFGFEFGKKTLTLTVKQGTDEKTGTVLNAHLQEYHHSYNWKAFVLGFFLLTRFKFISISIPIY